MRSTRSWNEFLSQAVPGEIPYQPPPRARPRGKCGELKKTCFPLGRAEGASNSKTPITAKVGGGTHHTERAERILIPASHVRR